MELYQNLIYLMGCSLHGTTPQWAEKNEKELKALYRIAQRHSVSAMCCTALEKTEAFSHCDPEVAAKWLEEKNKAIRNLIVMDIERQKICSFMEQEGIWYMPLKGILLKEFYPEPGMRQMADNDILYDSAGQKKLKRYMLSQGYVAKSVGKGNHDVYHKAPVYNFEMHTALYGASHQEGWAEYYKNIKEHLLPDEDCHFGFHFREEDFYVYIVSHTYKHYNNSGTGIRSLADLYVYLKKMEGQLDWNYIEQELEKLQIAEYEKDARKLCKKLFASEHQKLSVEEQEQLSYYMGSGTYGTIKNGVTKKLRKVQPGEEKITHATKGKYFLRRLIPDQRFYEQNYPFIYQHKWLIPGFVIFRCIRGILRNGKRIWSEIRTVRNS